jgi:hypothetical protein
MSRASYSPTLTLRLLEVERTVSSLQSTGVVGDPERMTRDLEALLDTLALRDPQSLVCEDCGDILPDYRQRRWYHPAPNELVFDILCRSCESTREDKESDTAAFHRAATTH